METKKSISIDVWRFGIQDRKQWSKWYWSNDYATYDQMMQIVVPWIETHPGCAIRFIKETRFQ